MYNLRWTSTGFFLVSVICAVGNFWVENYSMALFWGICALLWGYHTLDDWSGK